MKPDAQVPATACRSMMTWGPRQKKKMRAFPVSQMALCVLESCVEHVGGVRQTLDLLDSTETQKSFFLLLSKPCIPKHHFPIV
jgi:hypothetical protein